MRLFLSSGVHAVAVRDDIVFLDTAADAYFCLGGAGDIIRLRPGGAFDVTRDAPATQLLEAGLLSRERSADRSAPLVAPSASIRLSRAEPVRPSLGATLTALRVTRAVSRRFARFSFANLLAGRPAGLAAGQEPSTALIAAVEQFEHLRPWLPLSGECLLRSYHLRAFLRARGLDALWVFGVRTWPFAAHCWLQAGTTALDDDLERLAAYSPILAV